MEQKYVSRKSPCNHATRIRICISAYQLHICGGDNLLPARIMYHEAVNSDGFVVGF